MYIVLGVVATAVLAAVGGAIASLVVVKVKLRGVNAPAAYPQPYPPQQGFGQPPYPPQ